MWPPDGVGTGPLSSPRPLRQKNPPSPLPPSNKHNINNTASLSYRLPHRLPFNVRSNSSSNISNINNNSNNVGNIHLHNTSLLASLDCNSHSTGNILVPLTNVSPNTGLVDNNVIMDCNDSETSKCKKKPDKKGKKHMTLLASFKSSWKSRNNHFVRYSDVTIKNDKSGAADNINELSGHKMALQQLEGWKVRLGLQLFETPIMFSYNSSVLLSLLLQC